jgi:hypothetical protein
MAADLMNILTGAGLAGASGHRAFLPPLLLGVAHRAEWFTLSEKFQWLADPKVMAILAVLTIVEYVAEKNPDAPELVNLALKLPKLVSGFVVAAAATGTVDENVMLLATSGLFGSGISLSVDKLRADVKHAVQEPLSDATHGHSDRAMGVAETAWSGFLAVMAWVVPILAILALGVLVGVWFARRKFEDANRVACPKCGHEVMAAARVCPGCKADLVASSAIPVTAALTASPSPADPPVV